MARQASKNNSCSVVIASAGLATPCMPIIVESAQLAVKLNICRKPPTTADWSASTAGCELDRQADAADLQCGSPSVNLYKGDRRCRREYKQGRDKQGIRLSPAANLLLDVCLAGLFIVEHDVRVGRTVPKAPHAQWHVGRGISSQRGAQNPLAPILFSRHNSRYINDNAVPGARLQRLHFAS